VTRHFDDNGDSGSHPFDDLRGLTFDELCNEGSRLRRAIAGWVDRAGDAREYNQHVSRLDEVNRRIEAHTGVRAALDRGGRRTEMPFAGRAPGLVHRGDPLSDLPARDALRLGHEEARDRALQALEVRGRNLRPEQQDQVDELLRATISEDNPSLDGSYIAKRTLITETDDYRSAWRQLVTDPHPLLTATEIESVRALRALDIEYRGMSEGVTTAGGFGIPVFIDPSIVMTAQGSGNPFLSVGRVVRVTTNQWKGVSSAGVSWSFDAEGATVSDDSPTIAQPAVDVFTARGFLKWTIEVGQDYPSFAEEMAGLLGEGYDELVLDKMSRGSGSGEPMGIITALDADTTAEVLLTTAGAFGEVDLYNVWKALPQRFRGIGLNQAGAGGTNRPRGASWMMSVGVNNAIRRFGTANVFHASTETIAFEWVDRLMNRQVYESPYFPDVVATTGHTNQLVVGDFRHYVLALRAGMSMELVQHIVDVTSNRPTGERGTFAWARIGGGPDTTAAFRLLNST